MDRTRRPAGHAGADDPEDARDARAAARLRHRPADRADERATRCAQPGHALSRAGEARAAGLDHAKWGASENNRRAKFYSLTRAGAAQLAAEAERWARMAAIVARFLDGAEDSRERAARALVDAASSGFGAAAESSAISTRKSGIISILRPTITVASRTVAVTRRGRAARRDFGGVDCRSREAVRDRRGFRAPGTLAAGHSLRLRLLRKTPGFTFAAS